jgi:hypothetical protein
MDMMYSRNLFPYVLRRARVRLQGLFFALCVMGTPSILGAEIDRLLVTVNGKVITEGDLSLARGLNEVLSYGQDTKLNSKDSELDRLVNLELMRQELTSFSMMKAGLKPAFSRSGMYTRARAAFRRFCES